MLMLERERVNTSPAVQTSTQRMLFVIRIANHTMRMAPHGESGQTHGHLCRDRKTGEAGQCERKRVSRVLARAPHAQPCGPRSIGISHLDNEISCLEACAAETRELSGCRFLLLGAVRRGRETALLSFAPAPKRWGGWPPNVVGQGPTAVYERSGASGALCSHISQLTRLCRLHQMQGSAAWAVGDEIEASNSWA